jgi:hypothetical protein
VHLVDWVCFVIRKTMTDQHMPTRKTNKTERRAPVTQVTERATAGRRDRSGKEKRRFSLCSYVPPAPSRLEDFHLLCFAALQSQPSFSRHLHNCSTNRKTAVTIPRSEPMAEGTDLEKLSDNTIGEVKTPCVPPVEASAIDPNLVRPDRSPLNPVR